MSSNEEEVQGGCHQISPLYCTRVIDHVTTLIDAHACN